MSESRLTVINEPFILLRANGQRQSFQLVIYAPEPARRKDPWWWNCAVSLSPLYASEIRYGGRTPFHALANAITNATAGLSRFIASGGKILRPSGEDVGVPSLKSSAFAFDDNG